MSDPSLPHWWRMLGWGLLASLLLHWIAFDIMRAASGGSQAIAGPSLRVSLRPLASRVSQDVLSDTPSVKPQPERKSMLPPEPKHDSAMKNQAVRGPGAPSPAPTRQPSEAQGFVDTTVLGLRSGQPAEAMVGLRLALAQLLGQTSISSLTGGVKGERLMLLCDFDATGHLLAVRSASGTMDAAVELLVRRALTQLILPAALIGTAFSMDLLLEPD